MSEREKLIAMVKKNIDINGIVVDLLDELLEPALQRIVDSTENPFDNMLMSVYPILEQELKEAVKEKLDSLFE